MTVPETITHLSPDVVYQAASPENPSIFVIVNPDPNAAAAAVSILGLPSPGITWPTSPPVARLLLAVVSTLAGITGEYWHTLVACDTPLAVAEDFAAQINADTRMSAVGVGAQMTPGQAFFGVSHVWNDVITVGCAAFNSAGTQVPIDEGGFAAVTQGSSQLDSGTCIVGERFIAGRTPMMNDNIWQQFGLGATVENTAAASVQYSGWATNIKDPRSDTISGEFSIQTAAPGPTGPTIAQRFGITKGMYDPNATGGDMGPGTINVSNGFFVNGARIA